MAVQACVSAEAAWTHPTHHDDVKCYYMHGNGRSEQSFSQNGHCHLICRHGLGTTRIACTITADSHPCSNRELKPAALVEARGCVASGFHAVVRGPQAFICYKH